ncbi:MAG TPA: MraY family glycosyltransferase [Nevskiales bacterium]|nr:MraY family glycosyltransferase [Nevskiales bacterium]
MTAASWVVTLVGAGVALGIVLVLVPLLRPLALRVGLVDTPDERKRHDGAIPLVGGMAVFGGYMLALLIMGQKELWRVAEFWVWLGLLVLSLWDDIRHIKVGIRVLLQVLLIILLTAYSGMQLEQLGHLLGDRPLLLGNLALPVTILGLIGIKNGINLIDGLDGLAGTQVLVVLFWFMVLAFDSHVTLLLMLCAPLAGAVLGFLVYNLRLPGRPARIFLGDHGSVFLGFTLGWFAVIGSQWQVPAFTPIEAVWVLGLPVLDTIRVMAARMARGLSPFSPGRDHLHHLLLDCGLTSNGVVIVLLLASLAMGGVAWAGRLLGLSEMLLFAGFLALSLVFFVGAQYLDRRLHPKARIRG